MKKMILLNPGPVNVSPSVRRALLGSDICHREPEYAALSRSVRTKLLGIFGLQKSHSVALFSGSGTTAVEAMMGTFASPDKEILILSNGVYGQRLKAILERKGTPFTFLEAAAGEFPSKADIERELARKNVEAVAMVHHETSTGMLNPLNEVSKLARKHGKFVLVDAVSSIGAEKIDFSGLDLCAGTSGKCLHGFPGISFVLVSKNAKQVLGGRKGLSLTLDLGNALRHTEADDTAFTPAVQVLYAFNQALTELSKEGVSHRIAQYKTLSGMVTKGLLEMGVQPVIENAADRSHVLQAFWTPENISYAKLHDELKKQGFVIYAGQSEFKDKIFRISNLGDLKAADFKRFLKITQKILKSSR